MPSYTPKLRVQTDNHSLNEKCDLRRLVIGEAGLEPCRVLDLFAGEGNIWTELKRKHRDPNAPAPLKVTHYIPVDSANRQPGQIQKKITRRIIAAFNGDPDEESCAGSDLMRYNVVDVDTYGDPWEIWQALLFRIKTKTAVFLTRGKVTGPAGRGKLPISGLAKKLMGIPASWDVPGKMELMNFSDRYQLLQPCATAQITKGYMIESGRVDYYGLIVEPVTQT